MPDEASSRENTGLALFGHRPTALALLAAFILAAASCLTGQSAGLPSERRTLLTFGSKERVTQLAPVLVKLREEVFQAYDRATEIRYSFQPGSKEIEVSLDGKKTAVPENKLHALRSALLQTRYPDEQTTLAALTRINPAKGRFDPGYYLYGGLFFYTAGAGIKFASVAGLFDLSYDIAHYFSNAADARMLYIAPKVLTALIGLLAIPALFLAGMELGGRRTGLLAALFLAVTPAIAVEAHCLKPYLLFLPFMVLSVFFALRFLNTGEKRFSAWSGAMAGLSAGIYMTSGTAAFALAAAHLIRARRAGGVWRALEWKSLFLGVAAAALAFLAANPYYLISFGKFAAYMQAIQAEVGRSFAFSNIIEHSFFGLQKTLGLPLYLVALAGLAAAAWKRSAEDLVLLAVIAPFYLNNITSLWYNPHYDMPMVPVLLLWGARALSLLAESGLRRTFRFIAAAVLVASAARCLHYSTVFLRADDLYFRAGEWINASIPRGASISAELYPSIGAARGYPPFRLLDYRVNEAAEPDYFIDTPEFFTFRQKPPLPAGYKPLKTFTLTPVLLDRFFRNELVYFLGQPIDIYCRPDVCSKGGA